MTAGMSACVRSQDWAPSAATSNLTRSGARPSSPSTAASCSNASAWHCAGASTDTPDCRRRSQSASSSTRFSTICARCATRASWASNVSRPLSASPYISMASTGAMRAASGHAPHSTRKAWLPGLMAYTRASQSAASCKGAGAAVRSTSATRSPAPSSAQARLKPTSPPPTIATSQSSAFTGFAIKFCGCYASYRTLQPAVSGFGTILRPAP